MEEGWLTRLLIGLARLTSQPKLHNSCPAPTAKPTGTELPLHGGRLRHPVSAVALGCPCSFIFTP